MNTDLSDHPFSPESVHRECGGADDDVRLWLRWIAQAERLLGHTLDGDDVQHRGCGYSLDEAGEWFDTANTPEEYVAEIRSRPRYRSPS